MAKKSLKKKDGGPIRTGKFSVDESRVYITAGIICFHILPLLFVFMGETGQQILLNLFLVIMNPMFLFCLCCFHACRLGFCVKFPLLMGVLSTLSVMMYYSGMDAKSKIITVFTMMIVYMVFAFCSELIGGFLKKVIGG
jgi:hypothetical protein